MAEFLSPAIRDRLTRLSDIPDDQLACRAGRHDWPSNHLRAGKPVPKGYHPELQRDGHYLVTEYCPSCSKERITLKTPQGYDTYRRYVDPTNWVRIPIDAEITRIDLVAENFNRCLPAIKKVQTIQAEETEGNE